jgi:acyl-CoA thioester hydrolase
MYSFESNYRVRYADIDQMGFMYYGNYAKLFEIGRVEALRNLGVR